MGSKNLRILYLTIVSIFFSGKISAQVYGCTDPLANNYNVAADTNDGSCLYNPASVSAVTSILLDSVLSETSGLVFVNDLLMTHNDNSDTSLYSIDTLSGTILQQYQLANVVNYDWEDVASDSNYLYVGDFGNNVNGNRTDLHILRIDKTSLLNNTPVIDTIYFSYSDQIDFTPTGANNTDFDCEAFVVSEDSIFLFTKQWVSNQSSIYALTKFPGNHIANYRSTLNVQGMITGATYVESKRLITMCGYTNLLQPFLYLLYDFDQLNFLSGNKRRLTLSLPFHQVEGIATNNGLKYFCTNEKFVQAPVINNPAKLHTLDLSPFFSNYLDELILHSPENEILVDNIYPVPVIDKVHVKIDQSIIGATYLISDLSGKSIVAGEFHSRKMKLTCHKLVPVYISFRSLMQNQKLLFIG